MNSHAAARTLRIVAVLYIMSGIVMAAGAAPALSQPLALFYDIADWPADGGAPEMTRGFRLLAAISGGVFAGFSALFLTVIAPLVERADPLGRTGGVAALATWFVIDSSCSALAGVPTNAALNVLFLAPLLLPLLASSGARSPA